MNYLKSLPKAIDPRCEAGHYYLLNNYNPGYFGDGSNAFTDTNSNNTVFTIPPSSMRSIADELLEKGISWKYYGDQWNNYLVDKYQLNYGDFGAASDEYCNICNPFQYDTSIMANAAVRTEHIQDTVEPVRGYREQHFACGFVREAQRFRRWPSGIVEARSVRRLREEDRGRSAGQPESLG